MRAEDLWQQMEEEGASTGWATRLARPDPECRLMVALECSSRSRALLLRVNPATIPPRREWPECRGLEILAVVHRSDTYLAVRLRDAASRDVFAALAEVLVARVVAATSEQDAVARLFGGLRQWQMLLSAARYGLSPEAQRGLFGELYFLDRVLVPALGAADGARSWTGFMGAPQDFQLNAVSVEVKTTAAAAPSAVRITGERQLDPIGAGELFLHVIVVDERETAPGPGVTGETLAEIVASSRSSLGADPLARFILEDGLLAAGWLDAHASRHDTRRLTVRSQLSFQVRDGFPRLLGKDLPPGVREVSYNVDLAACSTFAVPMTTMMARIAPVRNAGGKP